MGVRERENQQCLCKRRVDIDAIGPAKAGNKRGWRNQSKEEAWLHRAKEFSV